MSLLHSIKLPCADSNGDLCALHVRSLGSGESAPNNTANVCNNRCVVSMRGCRGGGGGRGSGTPLKNHKSIGFFSYTGPDLLKNHKATKPVFNVGPIIARF